MMKALAKAGFSQSYTYFTWRNSKRELIEYFTELTQTEMNIFVLIFGRTRLTSCRLGFRTAGGLR